MRNRLIAVALVSVLAAACGSASSEDAPILPSFTAVEALRVGSANDPITAFTAFIALAVAPDGRIYTLHRSENTIRVHDANGSLLRTIGREGDGPGEFRGLLGMGIRDDTLWVFDSESHRFTLFDLDGALIGSRGFQVDFGDRTRNPPRPRGMLSDGTIWGAPPAWSSDVADGTLTRHVLVRFNGEGTVIDTIAAYSIANTSWRLADPNSESGFQSFRQQPFADAELVVISPTRLELIRVDRTVRADARRAEFTVSRIGLDGDTLATRSFAYRPVPIPERLPDSLAAAFASHLADLPADFRANAPTPAKGEQLARESLYLPPFRPPVSGVVPGNDGTVWVKREESGGAWQSWWVLDAQLRPLAAVELPTRFRMFAAVRGLVWGAESDELDVPYLVSYRIQP